MIDILTFAPHHAAGVVSVILPIQQSEFSIPITLEAQPDIQDIPNFYQHGNGNFWVAVDGPRVVGTLALLDIGVHRVALRKMFVHPDYRGGEHSAARRLLETGLAWCRKMSVHRIYLGTTAKFLAAHRFYEKNGFHEIPRADLPPEFPIMAVDTKFYSLALGAKS
jgi:N-acetylglutamate synthase-like GNAT family acetyltransferase